MKKSKGIALEGFLHCASDWGGEYCAIFPKEITKKERLETLKAIKGLGRETWRNKETLDYLVNGTLVFLRLVQKHKAVDVSDVLQKFEGGKIRLEITLVGERQVR